MDNSDTFSVSEQKVCLIVEDLVENSIIFKRINAQHCTKNIVKSLDDVSQDVEYYFTTTETII